MSNDDLVRGRRAGRANAEKALASGVPRRMCVGLLAESFDPASGLPFGSTGCELGDEDLGFCEAYNETVTAAIADGRARTLKHKLMTSDALAAAFERGPFEILVCTSPPLPGPGGRFLLEVRREQGYSFVLYISEPLKGRSNFLVRSGERVDVLFLHGDSTLAIRYDDPHTPGTTLLKTFELAWDLVFELQSFTRS